MFFRRLIVAALFCGSLPSMAFAQSDTEPPGNLIVELNAIQDVSGSCRLTFLVKNETEHSIDGAVFETVVFDAEGGVISLSLFDFRELPASRPRVRQFDLPNRACDTVGQALINGTNSCVVAGSESEICEKALTLSSRVDMELLG
ncbi:hypothetical protein [Ruegeria sp. 6PALISEP08]|uniref:hypothetical protein n=1 Tax=Ruegeria sp. 6PALISEP08 TaxID=1225660 RepID=UPI00067EBEB6|nr:hypothetical protein [Ruegeria sp. 6PALISEP08]